jgi:preprotein translocase subunit SecD
MIRLSPPFYGALSVATLLLSTVSAWADPITLRIARAEVAYDQRTGERIIGIVFHEASKQLFADLTARNLGKAMEMRVDGRTVLKSVVREPILGGSVQITSGFTMEQAREIAERLSAGAAKLEVEVSAD